MRLNTIKWKIFKYNLVIISLLILLVALIFNGAIRMYFEKDITEQLNKIAVKIEDTAIRQGPGFLPERQPPRPPDDNIKTPRAMEPPIQFDDVDHELIRFYFMLDRSLREPLSVLNANYILLDKNISRITPPFEDLTPSEDLLNEIMNQINLLEDMSVENFLSFHINGIKYVTIVKPVSEQDTLDLGWVVIYSSLEKVTEVQWVINIILLNILLFSSITIVILSSSLSKKISSPFSSLNAHLRAMAERKFGTRLNIAVDDELQDFVNNINLLSEKLETYDQAQKTFLQNVSHEFRTPLMSIQSYGEGIKYEVVDTNTAADIIIDESKRLTNLVGDLLYLSRLDTIEENYNFNHLDLKELLNSCIERIKAIAFKNNIEIKIDSFDLDIIIYGDEEKLFKAITNILSNCIRYAKKTIEITLTVKNSKIKLTIADDGTGFDKNDLPNVFDRFYKGKKGNFGLGLAISKNVIEKHNGKIRAKNSGSGAVFVLELPIDH